MYGIGNDSKLEDRLLHYSAKVLNNYEITCTIPTTICSKRGGEGVPLPPYWLDDDSLSRNIDRANFTCAHGSQEMHRNEVRTGYTT
jgi:hypothetical protein